MLQYNKADSDTGDNYSTAIAVVSRITLNTETQVGTYQIDTYINLAQFQAGSSPRYTKTYTMTRNQFNNIITHIKNDMYNALLSNTVEFPGASLA